MAVPGATVAVVYRTRIRLKGLGTHVSLPFHRSLFGGVQDCAAAAILLVVLASMDVAHFYLDGNTDAVEFCPHNSCSDVLAALTYTLQEGNNPSRSGSVVLFNVNAGSCRLDLVHCLESTGIFDIKWRPVEADIGHALLAQANSDGLVKVHGLESSLDGQQKSLYAQWICTC